MARYLFRFGFCSPEQWEANEEHDWDDESSEAFFIEASSREIALLWGCEVVESFTRSLFQMADWKGEIPSWKESGFAYWIEEDPEEVRSCQSLRQLPEVQVGEMPAFSEW